ncbi:unnamed protein product [Colias eurytheme]|nr:unnamed protein product [Colias eurytheme]
MALPILHLFAGILYFYALWYDQKYVEVNYMDGLDGYPFKNRVLLLTIWTLILQALYMTTAFLNDVIGTNEVSPRKPPAIRQIKDIIFGLAYPSAIYVSIAFWGIYHVQKDLIYPEHVERAYPPWLNHVMHTITVVHRMSPSKGGLECVS